MCEEWEGGGYCPDEGDVFIKHVFLRDKIYFFSGCFIVNFEVSVIGHWSFVITFLFSGRFLQINALSLSHHDAGKLFLDSEKRQENLKFIHLASTPSRPYKLQALIL